ncbi:cytochrome C [Pseudomonadota bacterium]
MTARKADKPFRDRLKALACLGLTAGTIYATPTLTGLTVAHASGAISIAKDPLTVAECGECHIPYAPRYLRAYAWQKLMANLDDHFGEDASLDEATRQQIEEYLIHKAGKPRKFVIKISERSWFKKEHNERNVSAKSLAKARSFANCQACHKIRK